MNSEIPELVVVIMAGGAGTRFWPLSTADKPKQFLNLFGGRTLIQQSYERAAALAPKERILVLTNEAFVPLVREQLPHLPAGNIIGEPLRRDTAAAVAFAALLCRKRYGKAVMIVLTADHLIEPVELFTRTVISAAKAASTHPVLYTFGIQPTYPATCYGYLERGEAVGGDEEVEHYKLLCFKEKPDEATARRYIESGRYYWNSGMFVWSLDAILGELERQLPQHLDLLAPVVEAEGCPGWQEALRRAFEPLVATSIDFGVMEGAQSARMVAARFNWNDVGGWLALQEYLDKDQAGNAHRGNIEALDARGNLVFCENPD